MAGNSMKLIGAVILAIMSVLAIILSVEVKLLSPIGGIFIVGMGFLGAILMWQDAAERWPKVGAERAERTETER